MNPSDLHPPHWQLSEREASANLDALDPSRASPWSDVIANATEVSLAVDVQRAQRLLDPALPCVRRMLSGMKPNRDVLVNA